MQNLGRYAEIGFCKGEKSVSYAGSREEAQKGEGRDCCPFGRPLAHRAAFGPEENAQKAAQNYQEGCVCYDSRVACCLSQLPVASKQRQVKRGVKEVVKAIRKGERGYVRTLVCARP